MVDAFDIVIRRARFRGRDDQLADIGIKDGRIANIAQGLEGKVVMEIDAHGNLVTESFVNPHLHLCKVWTLPMMEEEALRAYQGEAMGQSPGRNRVGEQDQGKIRGVMDHRECPPSRGLGCRAWQPPHPGVCRCRQQSAP